MLRQDGAQRSPKDKMRSGTRSGFWTLKATKKNKKTKILIYLLAFTILNTDWGGGKRTAHQWLSEGAGKAKQYNSLKDCSLGGSVKSIIIWYIPDNKYSCLLLLKRGSICAASITRWAAKHAAHVICSLWPSILELIFTMIIYLSKT